MIKSLIISLFFVIVVTKCRKFSFNSSDFLLDDQQFTIRSGEMHFARIPPEYWSHHLKMAKAMGPNTIATYVFWNFHQPTEDTFDFP
jgi:beta-galactosidase